MMVRDPRALQLRSAADQGESTMVKDPVCGMMIDEKTAAATSDYQGQIYYFCAQSCKDRFDKNPERFVARDR